MTSRPRPRELAILMLAAATKPPRKRARDQKPDLYGLGLRQRLLEQLTQFDPEEQDLERALLELIEKLDLPSGPARAIAANLRDDMLAACEQPTLIEHLIDEAFYSQNSHRD